MNQFPPDLLYNIFIQLPFRQKQECRLVCRQWNNFISMRCLYHSIFIGPSNEIEGLSSYTRFTEIMNATPDLRKQVVILFLHLSAVEDLDTTYLINSFANLRKVYYSQKAVVFQDYFSDTSNSKSIEYIVDTGSCNLLRAITSLNMGSQLVHLDLSLNQSTGAGSATANDFFDILPALKNVPMLQHLNLGRCSYSIDDLDILHNRVPSLKTLHIEFAFLSPPCEDMVNIDPAEQMTDVSIEVFPSYMDESVQLLEYISLKYTHLQHFKFFFHCYEYSESDDEKWKVINQSGYLPLIKQLRPQLQSLSLDGTEFDKHSIISELDASRSQLTKLALCTNYDDKFITLLSHSNQVKSIQDLTLSRLAPSISFTWLKKMTALKSLDLYYMGSDEDDDCVVNLNTLFNACPKSLKSISIINPSIQFNTRATRQTFPIEKLKIYSYDLPIGFDKFVSNYLPKLHTLILDSCLAENAVLKMPNHHFYLVDIRSPYHVRNGGTVFVDLTSNRTTTTDSRPCYFTTRENQISYNPKGGDYLYPTPADELGVRHFITLQCASIKTLKVNKNDVLLEASNPTYFYI